MQESLVKTGLRFKRWFRPSILEDSTNTFSVGRVRIYPVLMLIFGLGNTIFGVVINGPIGGLIAPCYLAITYATMFFIDYEDHPAPWVGYPVFLFKWGTLVAVAASFFFSFWVLNEYHLLQQAAADYAIERAAWEKERDKFDAKLETWQADQAAREERAIRKSESQKDLARSQAQAIGRAERLTRLTGQTVRVNLSAASDQDESGEQLTLESLGKRPVEPLKPASANGFLIIWKWNGVKVAGAEVGMLLFGLLWLGLGSKIYNHMNAPPKPFSNETGKPAETSLPLSPLDEISPSPSEEVKTEVETPEIKAPEVTREMGDRGSHPDSPMGDPESPKDVELVTRVVTQETSAAPEELVNPIACYEGTYAICNERYALRKRKGHGWDLRYRGKPPEGQKPDIGYLGDPEGRKLVEAEPEHQEFLMAGILRKKGKGERLLAKRATG